MALTANAKAPNVVRYDFGQLDSFIVNWQGNTSYIAGVQNAARALCFALDGPKRIKKIAYSVNAKQTTGSFGSAIDMIARLIVLRNYTGFPLDPLLFDPVITDNTNIGGSSGTPSSGIDWQVGGVSVKRFDWDAFAADIIFQRYIGNSAGNNARYDRDVIDIDIPIPVDKKVLVVLTPVYGQQYPSQGGDSPPTFGGVGAFMGTAFATADIANSGTHPFRSLAVYGDYNDECC